MRVLGLLRCNDMTILSKMADVATPLSGQEWGLANLMTSEALERIAAIGGPRCCKRDSFTAVSAAAEFIEEKFGIRLEMPEKIICGFYPMNGQCLGDRCPFHP